MSETLNQEAFDIAAHIWTDVLGARGDYNGWMDDKSKAATLIHVALNKHDAQIAALTEKAEEYARQADRRAADVGELTVQLDDAVKALEKYGEHLDTCAAFSEDDFAMPPMYMFTPEDCDCGLKDTLTRIRAGTPVEKEKQS